MKVIYVDNHLLAVAKPAGIVTQGGLDILAKEWIKARGGGVFLEPIHRLDKSASGIVLFARTRKALSRLNAMMREQQIEKTYLAYVEKIPSLEMATLEHYLVHGSFRARVAPHGKRSLLTYKVLKNNLLEISLHTGRYHQIRAQLAAVGCPIVGDTKYGAKRRTEIGIALYHTQMRLMHPVTQEPLVFLLRDYKESKKKSYGCEKNGSEIKSKEGLFWDDFKM